MVKLFFNAFHKYEFIGLYIQTSMYCGLCQILECNLLHFDVFVGIVFNVGKAYCKLFVVPKL